MSILDWLFQLVAAPRIVVSEEERTFITSLATSDIWILAVGIRGTPAIPAVVNAASLDALARYRIDVSEIGDDDSVFPFNYEETGKQLLPFFTSEERANQFVAASAPSFDSSVFQPYPLLAGFVASPANADFDLILDPRTPGERRINDDERRLLLTLTTARDTRE